MKMLKIFLFITFYSLSIFCVECALVEAVKNGDVETVFKCANASNVNGGDPKSTLLHEAVKIRDLEKAKKITTHLLSLGADTQKENADGFTASELASLRSFVLRELIDNETKPYNENNQFYSDENVVVVVKFVQSKL